MNSLLIHIKATLEQPKTMGVYQWKSVTEENFHGFNVPFRYFGKYIQDVICTEVVETIIQVKDEDAFKRIKKWKKDPLMIKEFNIDHQIFFNTDKDKLSSEIETYEKEQRLTKLHVLEHGMFKKYYKIVKKRGFYIQHAGLLDGGVAENFLRSFGNEKIAAYALQEDFKYAYECMESSSYDTPEEAAIRRKNFRENFMDNYELGASYLWLE